MSERDLFLAALDLPESDRARFLAEKCGPDADLRKRVDALLLAHADAGSFLDPANPETRATLNEQPATASYHTRPARTRDDGQNATRTDPTAAETPTAGEAAGVRIAGRYKLLQPIGEGGMGTVWLAEQTEPVKRKVAVKLIRAERGRSSAILARFEAERQAIALMDHPHIARLFDAGTEGGQPFFVMELVKGVPLTEFCDAHRLSVPDRLHLFTQICQAVQHAHQKGVIHRDLKPSNILVETHDGKPVPKVIDFGLAKATSGLHLTDRTTDTGFGTVLGTPLYMAPEQANLNAEDVDTRADIYALGVILYELLTGTTPLTRETVKKAQLDEMLRLIREQEAVTPSSRLSSSDAKPAVAANRQTEPAKLGRFLRGDLDWIVMKALAKERDRRYETANGFARDVERFLSHEPVSAGPPTASYRLRKFVRRNRGPVLAGAVVLFALLAGMLGTTLGLLEARRQEGIARQEAEAKETARRDEQQQRTAAQASAARAEKAYSRTADVLDAMTSDLTENVLLRQAAVSDEQKKFLAQALDYYTEFATTAAEGEEARLRVARAAYRVAVIESRLYRADRAGAAYRTACDLFGNLVADFPGNPTYRLALATCHNNLGVQLNEQRKPAEAAVEYRTAVALREKLAAEFPDDPEYRQQVAAARVNLAAVTNGAERAAVEADAVAAQEKLAKDFPDNPRLRHELAGTKANQGLDLIRRGKHDDGRERVREALAIQEKLVAEHPADKDYRQNLYRSLQFLGSSYAAQRRPADAAEQYTRALGVQLKLVADFPAMPQYRQEAAVTRVNLGNELINQGKLAGGEEQYRESAKGFEKLIAEVPAEATYRQQVNSVYTNLGIILASTGRAADGHEFTAKALAIQEGLLAGTPTGSRPRLDFARACGEFAAALHAAGKPAEAAGWYIKAARVFAAAAGQVADEKAEYGGRAVDMLRKAVAAGYTDAARLTADKELDPLRDREDFKKLLTDLKPREVLPAPRRE